jgi:hypothetical protein
MAPSLHRSYGNDDRERNWVAPNKKRPPKIGGLLIRPFGRRLLRDDVGRLLALRALRHLERNRLTFLQRLVALTLDGGEVHEHILTVRLGNEAVTLVVVEPLHGAFCHHYFLSADEGGQARALPSTTPAVVRSKP